MKLFGVTDVGRHRKDNQDSFVFRELDGAALLLVCDGMGGMADGGRASRTAIQMMVQGFQRIEKEPEINIPMFFRQGIRTIDRVIYDFPKEDGRTRWRRPVPRPTRRCSSWPRPTRSTGGWALRWWRPWPCRGSPTW